MDKLFEKIAEYNSKTIFKHVRRHPQKIFHYADAHGVNGILSSNKIWATNIGYLNDHSEFIYSKDIILSCITSFINSSKNRKVRLTFDKVKEKFESLDNPSTSFFISCFCENKDLLSQWRAYGANGGGYSLGFYPNIMGIDPKKSGTSFDFRPVIYDRKIQEKLIFNFINFAAQEIPTLSESDDISEKSELANEIMMHLVEYMLMFKHPSFSEEKEWRIIQVAKIEDVKFRTSNNILVPYIEIDLSLKDDFGQSHLPLSDIVIGPTNNPKRAKGSIEWLCDKLELHEAEIWLSSIPLAG